MMKKLIIALAVVPLTASAQNYGYQVPTYGQPQVYNYGLGQPQAAVDPNSLQAQVDLAQQQAVTRNIQIQNELLQKELYKGLSMDSIAPTGNANQVGGYDFQ